MNPIVNSLLDTDFYKLTMMQLIYLRYPVANVEYEYKCRNDIDFTPELVSAFREQIESLEDITLSDKEVEYLRNNPFMRDDFVLFLKNFRFNPSYVNIEENPFRITVKGPWLHTILFEIPILAALSELKGVLHGGSRPFHFPDEQTFKESEKRILDKIKLVKDLKNPEFRLIEFGTRRRYSREWQEWVTATLAHELPHNLYGTSNVKLAMDYGLRPIGTMAHEYLQAFQRISPNLADFQKLALHTWLEVYPSGLGIALTDVIGMDAFLRDFDLPLAERYEGLRHDSGDPYEWTNKSLNHYKKLGLRAKSKNLVYSDGLDIVPSIELFKTFQKKINTGFGIGTKLTNDIYGIPPMNHVVKMVEFNGLPVAKISDAAGKSMCRDKGYEKMLRETF